MGKLVVASTVREDLRGEASGPLLFFENTGVCFGMFQLLRQILARLRRRAGAAAVHCDAPRSRESHSGLLVRSALAVLITPRHVLHAIKEAATSQNPN